MRTVQHRQIVFVTWLVAVAAVTVACSNKPTLIRYLEQQNPNTAEKDEVAAQTLKVLHTETPVTDIDQAVKNMRSLLVLNKEPWGKGWIPVQESRLYYYSYQNPDVTRFMVVRKNGHFVRLVTWDHRLPK